MTEPTLVSDSGNLRVAFVGMTHLGLVSAVGTAARGVRVVGVDPDPELISRLNIRKLPLTEPGLERALDANRDRLRFSADFADLTSCDVVYVAPDVPTDDEGRSENLQYPGAR